MFPATECSTGERYSPVSSSSLVHPAASRRMSRRTAWSRTVYVHLSWVETLHKGTLEWKCKDTGLMENQGHKWGASMMPRHWRWPLEGSGSARTLTVERGEPHQIVLQVNLDKCVREKRFCQPRTQGHEPEEHRTVPVAGRRQQQWGGGRTALEGEGMRWACPGWSSFLCSRL